MPTDENDPWRSFEERTLLAISEIASIYDEPRWRTWAEAFFSGADRTEKSASGMAQFTRDLGGITAPSELIRRLGPDPELEAIEDAAITEVTAGADDIGTLSRINMAVAATVADWAAVVFHSERPVQPETEFRASFESFIESAAIHVGLLKKQGE
jgi:hypothetical protein